MKKMTSINFLMKFFLSETIGFGIGVPVALFYGMIISPVFIGTGVGNFAEVLCKYAIAVGILVVVFLAFPANLIISKKIASFIDRFYQQKSDRSEIVHYFEKLHKLSFLHALLIFIRILIGSAIVTYFIRNELKCDLFTSLVTFLLGLHGAFLAGVIAYIIILRLTRPILLDIVHGGFLPDEIVSKKKMFGIGLFPRMLLFILAPLFLESLTLITSFAVISVHKITSMSLMFNLMEMVFLNFLLIASLVWVWYYQIRNSIKELTGSMSEFLSESGDLTNRIETTLDDNISYVAYLYNQISRNISGIIREVKANAKTVSVEIANIYEPLYEAVSSAMMSFKASEKIVNKSKTQKDLSSTNVQNTKMMEENIDHLRKFAGDFSDSLTQLLGDANLMADRLLKLKENSVDSIKKIEEGISNINSTETYLNAITTANSSVLTTAKEVNNVITVIEEIANQTNILSMNASIEASHAGASGKGFAVVANEIKKLANESRDNARISADQIGGLIESIEKNSSTSDSAIQGIKSNLQIFEKVRDFYQNLNAFFDEQDKVANKLNKEISGILDQMKRLLSLLEEQKVIIFKTADNIRLVGETSEEINVNIDKLSDQLNLLVKNINSSVESLDETKKMDEKLLQKFDQFKILD